jgi:hypothetical protein
MSFVFAQEVPYRPSQCPKCLLLAGNDRCKGFITKDAFGDMLGCFKGESNGPCPRFIAAEPPEVSLKTEMYCEQCGGELRDKAKFCANCGIPVQVTAQEAPSVLQCASCGGMLPGDAMFCEKCGSPAQKTEYQVQANPLLLNILPKLNLDFLKNINTRGWVAIAVVVPLLIFGICSLFSADKKSPPVSTAQTNPANTTGNKTGNTAQTNPGNSTKTSPGSSTQTNPSNSTNNTGTNNTAKTNMVEQPLPANGKVAKYYSNRMTSALEITTQGEDENHFIKVVDWDTGETVLTVFIRAGQSVATEVPEGSYEIRFAAGKTWYGEKNLFGPTTALGRTEEELIFTEDEGLRISLYPQVNGNLSMSEIEWGEF